MARVLTPAAETTRGIFGHHQAARSREPLFQVSLLPTQSDPSPQHSHFWGSHCGWCVAQGQCVASARDLRRPRMLFPSVPSAVGGTMDQRIPCCLASNCTRGMGFLSPWQGIQNAQAPHLSQPDTLCWLVWAFYSQDTSSSSTNDCPTQKRGFHVPVCRHTYLM